MKRKVLVSLGVLVAVLLVLPAVLPASVHVSRAVEVQAPKEKAFSYLMDFKDFSGWSPFQEMDPEQQVQLAGSGVGSSLTWKSKRMGEGTMTLESAETEAIRVRMVFHSPMKGEGLSVWRLAARDASVTEVTWEFDQKLPYFQRYVGLMMESGLGGHFERGLANLKGKLEAAAPATR